MPSHEFYPILSTSPILPAIRGYVILPPSRKWRVSPLEKRLARSYQLETPPQVRKSSGNNNQLPRDLILALMVQGYPLEELLEFFPMFTLDQLMLLLDEDIIH